MLVKVANSDAWRHQPVTVSAVLILYNQERYARQAVESLLAQTHPLEIVISDDGSTDATIAVVREALEDYEGPHDIRLRCGASNVGVCRNQNAALALTHGELIVFFEGDDVSYPNRVDRIVHRYLALDRKVAALGSAIRKIDEYGNPGEVVRWPTSRGDAWSLVRGEWQVHGCGLAVRRDCFFAVGPIPGHLISGDIALWVRAAMMRHGGMAQVSEVLLDYRVHRQNLSRQYRLDFSSPQALRRSCEKLLKNEVAQLADLKKIARCSPAAALSRDTEVQAWRKLAHIARMRACLVLAVSRHSRLRWAFVAIRCLRIKFLRRLATRVLVAALLPSARTLYRMIRGKVKIFSMQTPMGMANDHSACGVNPRSGD